MLRRIWREHRLGTLIVVAALIVASVGAFLLVAKDDTTPRTTAPTTTVPQVSPDVDGNLVATSVVSQLVIFDAPSKSAGTLATLGPTTAYRAPTTLAVDADRSEAPKGWLPVAVPLHKPNDTQGWIRQRDVRLTQSPFEIRVHLATHTLELLENGTQVFTTPVIIGTPETPTPVGRFHLMDPVNCNTPSVRAYPVGHCTSVYGAFAIGTSGLSDVLDSFDGGIPQIALHGTDLPASELGKDLSNGCIRMPNDAILHLARITPLLGTPVIISAT